MLFLVLFCVNLQSPEHSGNLIYENGLRRKKLKSFKDVGLKRWNRDFAIGFKVNMKDRNIELFWNRVSMGIAWENIPLKIIPAVSDGSSDRQAEYIVRRLNSFDDNKFSPPLINKDIYLSKSEIQEEE